MKNTFVYIERILPNNKSEYIKVFYIDEPKNKYIITHTDKGKFTKVISPWFPSGLFRFVISDEEKKNHKFKTVIVIS